MEDANELYLRGRVTASRRLPDEARQVRLGKTQTSDSGHEFTGRLLQADPNNPQLEQ